MKLKELFAVEIKSKTKEIVNKFKKKIDLAIPEAKEKAVKLYIAALLKEREDIFFNKTETQDPNFFIDDFTRDYFDYYYGLDSDFELEFGKAKHALLEKYQSHDFLPNIIFFFEQSDEELIIKIAHYKAYKLAWHQLEEWGKNLLTKQKKSTNELTGLKENIRKKKPINREQYKKLFKSTKAFNQAEAFISNNFTNENDVWVGYKNKAQEVGALVDLFLEKNYVTFSSRIFAIKLFKNRYDLKYSISATRQTGFAYKDFIEKFREELPPFVKPKEINE